MEVAAATIASTLRAARDKLTQRLELDPTVATLEASMLLGKVLDHDRAYFLAHAADALCIADEARFETLLNRRLAGEPIAYILGMREFYGLDFFVSPAVLIPRPETELLIDTALALIPPHSAFRVLDLGTGSGAIAISLAKFRPQASFTAVDYSPAALAVARQNALRLGVANIAFIQSDWFSALNTAHPYHLIIANPPYIAMDDPHTLRGDVRFEPRLALSSGADGLEAISHIARAAGAFLVKNGQLLFEHGYAQKDPCLEILNQQGFQDIRCLRDLNGQARAMLGRNSEP